MISTSCIISFHKAKFLPLNFLISIPVPNVEPIFIYGWGWPSLLLSVVKVLLLTFIFSCFSSPLCSNPLWYHLKTCSAHAEACGDRCGPYVRILSVMQGRSHTHTHTHTHRFTSLMENFKIILLQYMNVTTMLFNITLGFVLHCRECEFKENNIVFHFELQLCASFFLPRLHKSTSWLINNQKFHDRSFSSVCRRHLIDHSSILTDVDLPDISVDSIYG